MVTPTVTFSAAQTAQMRTESANGQTYQTPVYTTDTLTITAAASEAVSGTWKLDSSTSGASPEGESGQTGSFTGLRSISIPLTGLAEGQHTLTVEGRAAEDGDGFFTTYTFTVDTLPPQLLLSSPVNGSFFGKDGRLTVTGVTDADARFTLTSGGAEICAGKTVAQLGGAFDPATGVFSFTAALPDPNRASEHTLTLSVSDDVGNASAPQIVTVSHGGLADLASLEVMVNGQTYDNGNLPIPATGLTDMPLTLLGVTSDGVRFHLTGHNVSWALLTVEGTASLSDDRLTAAALSQGYVTGRLAVASGAYRTASLCFGASVDHTVAVSAAIGGSVTGGGQYRPGELVTLTATPDAGYRFTGWTITGVQVSDLSAPTISFSMPAAGNVTALAGFAPLSGDTGESGSGSTGSESVSAEAGELVRVKLPAGKSGEQYLPCYTDASGKLTFVPISAVLDGSVVFLAPVIGTYRFASNPVGFRDTASHWARESIAFCASHEIFRGTGGDRFDPDAPMTRAMFATVLYRIAGMPAASGTVGFADVTAGQWYTSAILWGQSTGIITGYGDGRFGTNDLVTREQMCALLVRYLRWAGYELPAGIAAKHFGDQAQIASWAVESVSFCQTRGLVNGRANDRFVPGANATRAENAAVFHRMILAILSSAR